MKKLSLLVLIIAFVQSANAQFETKRHEVALSYGVITIGQMLDVFSDVVGDVFTLGHATTKNREFTGAIGLQYAFQPVRWLGVGAVACFDRSTADVYQKEVQVGTTETNYFTIMPIAKFNWFDFRIVGMYSKCGFGYTIRSTEGNDFREESNTINSNTDGIVAFQISPVCLQVGTPTIRGFAEFGLGSQGVVNVGVKYRF